MDMDMVRLAIDITKKTPKTITNQFLIFSNQKISHR